MPTLNSKNLLGADIAGNYDKLVEQCPLCHHAIEPTCFRFGAVNDKVWLEMITRCPRNECQRTIIAHYKFKNQDGQGQRYYEYFAAFPILPKTADIDGDVAALSPAFVKIYNQALAAESGGLDEVFGIGLRKALEFLIKDYCIHNHPEKSTEIQEKFLGKVIKDYVVDSNVKRCAERAVWLGNDETHYMRTWETHDISDLKILIKLTVNWIANELATAKYFTSMPPSGPPAP